MKARLIVIAAILTAFILTNCKKDAYKTFIYTDKVQGSPLQLYIDNKHMGILPYLDNESKKDITSGKAFELPLKFGTHTITIMDSAGNIISSVNLWVSSYKVSSTSIAGSHSQSFKCALSKGIIELEFH